MTNSRPTPRRGGIGLPLRVRITLASVASTAAILAALGAFLYIRLDAELSRAVDLGLQARASAAAAGIGQQGVNFGDAPDSGPATVTQILTPAGRVEETSGPAKPLLSARALGSIRAPSFLKIPSAAGGVPLRVFVRPVNEGTPLFIVVGTSLAEQRRTLSRLVLLLGVGGPIALALASLAAWMLTGAALRPIEHMRAEAAAISVAEPARRLPVPATDDEVARLGTTFNSLLDRLQGALDDERRLLDDASHELRTPLAILKAELDLALSRSRTPEELEAAIRSASQETDRVTRLAEDLLVLSRSEGGRLRIHRVDTSLKELLDRASSAHRARSAAAGLKIEVDTSDTTVRVDPMRLRQALDNLLDNAMRYSPRGSTINVHARVSGGLVRVTVENRGQGFEANVLPRAFEPFVRDESNAGDLHEGAGLGLAIVGAVAEAHGGTAIAENLPEGGARVTMTFAVSPAEVVQRAL